MSRRLLLLLVAVAVLLAGYTAYSVATDPGPRSPPRSDRQLAGRLITDLPKGLSRQPDHLFINSGPAHLAEAVQDEGGFPESESALRGSGFLRGYRRYWLSRGETEMVYIYVYQHATAEGAQDNLKRVKAVTRTGQSNARPLPLPRLPADSLGFSGPFGPGGGAVVIFGTGPFVVKMACDGPTEEPMRTRCAALAVAQLRRLR
jgi:hypothetical protein